MFELHITCTKDIDDLTINFADGTSMVNQKKKQPNKPKKHPKVLDNNDETRYNVPINEEHHEQIVKNEVEHNIQTQKTFSPVKLPTIPDVIRDKPNVSEEIQNANF